MVIDAVKVPGSSGVDQVVEGVPPHQAEAVGPDGDGDELYVMEENIGRDFIPPTHAIPNQSLTTGIQGGNRMPWVEEVENEYFRDLRGNHYIEAFTSKPIATPLWKRKTGFEQRQEEEGDNLWAPFRDKEEWGLAQWLMTSVGQAKINEFLKLPIVSAPKFSSQLDTDDIPSW
ncbi:hypothetical protein JAAARDRAFT_197224 [Jaapia argillacea MUCL 33604]|uniref:Uncharacterized protein n=1 Tax=Jaapia argillacea MUCL 33604 TaxID=933084 RepID=A0A067PFU4_9AGAM|nr:hypothetical protein JAAARDRAFT_197224 [Jaapia argillacea MUCL 33604]